MTVTLNATKPLKLAVASVATVATIAFAGPQAQAQTQTPPRQQAPPQPRAAQPAVSSASAELGRIANEPMGGFVLTGQPSPMQYQNVAVLLRCQVELNQAGVRVPKQNSCTPATSAPVPLNQRVDVPAGDYLLGFENMVYPGLIQIKAGATREMKLVPLDIAPEFGKDARITVFRDLTKLEEQRKIYFAEFMAGQGLFPLTMPDGFDKKGLYPRLDETQKLFYQNARYQLCELKPLPTLSPKASRLCRMWKSRHYMALSEFFNFNNDGSFSQYLFIRTQALDGSTRAIDAKARRGARLLVTPYNTLAGSFINVLPGAYSIEVANRRGTKTTSVVVGYQNGTLVVDDPNSSVDTGFGPAIEPTALGRGSGLLAATQAATEVDTEVDDAEDETPHGKTCADVGVLYKTEFRSYCRSTGRAKTGGPKLFEPNVEGCDLNEVKFCEVLPVIK